MFRLLYYDSIFFLNASLFIRGKTKEEKVLTYQKIAKYLSKLWSVHIVEKNPFVWTQRKQLEYLATDELL